MLHGRAISDANWERIKDLVPGRTGRAAWGNRLFLDAVLWIANTGAPWRDLAERFGNWNSVWRRWARKGTWQRVFEALQAPNLEWLILDSTIVRTHAAGAKKSGRDRGTKRAGPGPQPGGFGTRFHAGLSGLGLPVKLILMAGQEADVSQGVKLIEGVPIEVVIGDKGS